jgi:Cof subfamily protein (haloacid dehalogenase superfamily)
MPTSNSTIKLIVADLDGTLLNADHRIGPVTERALRQAIDQGVLFTVATGKTFSSTQGLIEEFDIRIPVICNNGTRVYTPNGTMMHQDSIPLDIALEAIQMADKAGLVTVVYSGAELLATGIDANVRVLMDHHEPHPRIVPDLAAAFEECCYPDKVLFMNTHDLNAVATFQDKLSERFDGRAQVLRTGLLEIVEILPLGVSKGTALVFILDHLTIPPAATMSFGDSFNDLEMIQRAGIGVAMQNAPAAVREGADYVTGSNDDDGVGHAIERFVLTPHRKHKETIT